MMNETCETPISPSIASANRWHDLAKRVLDGHRLTEEEGLDHSPGRRRGVARSAGGGLSGASSLVRQPRPSELPDQREERPLRRRLRILRRNRGWRRPRSPDTSCSRPRRFSTAPGTAAERKAKTYCTAISGRSPSDRELDTLAEVVPRVKAAFGLKICLSVGLLSLEQARRLQAAGVDRINHNLNTSERFYPRICTTHSYQDRLATLRAVRQAGLEICSGGIVGMGEEDADVVELALRLGELRVEAVPVNFLLPIPGIRVAARVRAQPPILSQGAGPVPAGQSPRRVAGGGGAGIAPRPPAAVEPLSGQFDLCRRLSDHRRPAARGRLPHDRGDGFFGWELTGGGGSGIIARLSRKAPHRPQGATRELQ